MYLNRQPQYTLIIDNGLSMSQYNNRGEIEQVIHICIKDIGNSFI